MHGLASELRLDAGTSKLPAALSTGAVVAVLTLVCQPSLAAVIFAGPLAPFVARGAGAILFGSCALCLIAALAGSYRGTISLPHFAPAAALSAIGVAVAANMRAAPGEAVFATMIAIVALSTLTTAFCFLLIGRFRLAHLLRFMPYPLVGGFLAGLGWFLLQGGVAIASGTALTWETLPRLLESETIWRWLPGAVYAFGLLAVTKLWRHYLVLPVCLILAVGLCHLVLFLLGISSEEAREAGIFFVGLPPGASWPPIEPGDLARVDWGIVASQFLGILGVTLVALISIVLNAGALELGSGVELDMNREFRVEGTACLAAGLGGSSPGCNTASMSLVSHATGAETRLTGIVVAFGVGSVLFFGSGLLTLLPMPLLGGLVLFIGLGLLDDWLVAARRTLSLTDYVMVLAVSLVIGVFGFLEGVAAGLVAAVVFFVVRFSGMDVIGATFTGRERHSKRNRPAIHGAILRERGERMCVYRLRGYIIFGNASPMGERLKETLNADPAPLCLLLDFSGVTGFDVSAANAVCRSIRMARTRGTRIVLSAMPDRARSAVQRGLPESEWRSLTFEEDLDRGLEHCEDLVIAEWDRLHGGSTEARDILLGLAVEPAMRQLDRQAHLEALTERLRPWLEDRAYAAGEIIVARGERPEGMQFLAAGRATAHSDDDRARTAEHGPGDVFALQALFGDSAAGSSVEAVEPCRTMLMTPAARRSLEREDPELTVELDRYLIERLLEYRAGLSERSGEFDGGTAGKLDTP